jgi:hypothetical protein
VAAPAPWLDHGDATRFQGLCYGSLAMPMPHQPVMPARESCPDESRHDVEPESYELAEENAITCRCTSIGWLRSRTTGKPAF